MEDKFSLKTYLAGYNPNATRQVNEDVASLQEKCRLLEAENEALRDKLWTSDLRDATSKLKILDLEAEVEVLRQKLLALESDSTFQREEIIAMGGIIRSKGGICQEK